MFGFFVLLSSQCFALPTIVTESATGRTGDCPSGSGVALNVVHTPWSADKAFYIGFAIEMEIPGSGMGPQQMVVDSGSGITAFCNKEILQKVDLSPIQYPDSVVLQGDFSPFDPAASEFAPSDPPLEQCVGGNVALGAFYGGGNEFYHGYTYNGNLNINSQGVPTRGLGNGSYVIIEGYSAGLSLCDGEFDGIFGVFPSFFGGDATSGNVVLPNATAASVEQQVLCIAAKSAKGEHGADFDKICQGFDNTEKATNWCGPTVWLESPLLKGVQAEGTNPLLALHLDANHEDWQSLYKASGLLSNVGTAYFGKDALAIQNSRQALTAASGVGMDGYANMLVPNWNLQVNTITVISELGPIAPVVFNVTAMGTCLQPLPQGGVTNSGRCYVDSGTPELILPGVVYDAVMNASKGVLRFSLQGVGGDEIALDLPIQTLVAMSRVANATTNTAVVMPPNAAPGAGDRIVFGFPTWFFYDVVFDYGKSAADPFESNIYYGLLKGLPSPLFKHGQSVTFAKK